MNLAKLLRLSGLSLSVAVAISAPLQGQVVSSKRVSIETHGAVSDGRTLNTDKIQRAVDMLAAAGGGTLVVPRGTFLSGALFLKPGVNLHLEKGAVLKCSTNMADFPLRRTRVEGHFEESWSPALINADGCNGLRITGEGTLDGDGQPLWDLFWKLRNAADPKNFVSLSVPRARLCLIQSSKDVAVSGITFKDSQFWNLHLYNCQDAVVENCRFEIPDKGSGPSTDGVDIDSSQNIVVRGCYFSVNDDCVCLKGNRHDGLNQLPKSPPVRNVRVENCTFVRGHGALTLGTEAQSISEVEMKDCVVRGKMPMLRLKLRSDTPNQDYRNVRVHDIQLEGGEGEIVRVYPYYGTKVPPLKSPISKVSDLVIENVSGNFGSFGTLSGGGIATVRDVTFRNVRVTMAKDSELNTNGVAGVKFEDVLVRKAEGKQRPSPGRYTFGSFKFFTKDSPLLPSGLIGRVQLESTLSGSAAEKQAAPVARIAKFAGDCVAAISYTFDDGLRDQYTLAVPMLDEVGFKGTFFVIPGATAETPGEGEKKKSLKRAWGGISWPELKTMAAQGHEIASHTWSHPNLQKLSPEEVDVQLSKAYDAIKARIGQPPLTLAFPFNASTPEVRAAALKYHVACRTYQTAIGDKTTAASLNAWADKLVQEKKWGVIMAHAIGNGYSALRAPEIFHAHLKHVKSRGHEIWMDTFANISRYEKERDDAKLTLSGEAGNMTCVLSGTLNPLLYDVPLTIVIDAKGITSARAERAGKELPLRVESGSIYLQATPSRELITITWKQL